MQRIFFNQILLFTALYCVSSSAQDIENIKKEKPFTVSGNIALNTGYYYVSPFNSTRKNYTYSVMGAPVFSIYGVQIPVTFLITEGSKHLTNPFAQFGITPSYKWVKIYAGWNNMNWTPTTMGGKTFLGIGIELNPGAFRFGAMYGKFNLKIDEDTSKYSVNPQYGRTGYAFKIGIGKEKNFFDLILLKAKDDTANTKPISDILYNAPQENFVFGFNNFQTFLKGKLTWQLDAAASAHTRNLNSQKVNLDSDSNLFFFKTFFTPRLSTSFSWNVHTKFIYKGQFATLGFDYARILPEYVSFGADYLTNDLQKFTLDQSIQGKKGKIAISMVESYQHDNLNSRKAVQTNRFNYNLNLNYTANEKIGITGNYTFFMMNQQSGIRALNDTTKLIQIQQSILVSPRYLIFNETQSTMIMLSMMYQRLDDLNSFTSKFSNNELINININYARTSLSNNLTIAPSMNFLFNASPLFNLMMWSPSITLSKPFMKDKLNASVSLTNNISFANKSWNSNTINNLISLVYRFDKHHTLKFNNSITLTNAIITNSIETRGDLGYVYTF